MEKDFRNEEDVFVKNINIELNTVIESYTKCIRMDITCDIYFKDFF